MTAMLGVVLALSMAAGGHNGINGFDPSMVYVLTGQNMPIDIDAANSKEFLKWLREGDQEARANTVKYYIACAFGPTASIRVDRWIWDGAYGLAPTLHARIRTFVNGKGGSGRLDPPAAEGKWVSACLMALANMKGIHQYVALRGNPPASDGLRQTAGSRWALGYPEGVFFADLVNFGGGHPVPKPGTRPATLRAPAKWPPTPKKYLERSFTLSLNLPSGCGVGIEERPPNVPLGRTLDFAEETKVPLPSEPGEYFAARRLGTWQQSPRHDSLKPKDLDYRADEVCLRPDGTNPAVVRCNAQAPARWKPIFVHLPRFVALAHTEASDISKVLQATFEGKPGRPDPDQVKAWPLDGPVVGSRPMVSLKHPPACPPVAPESRTLGGLREGQAVTATLRYVASEEPRDLKVDMGERFTAIVRFRSDVDPDAVIEIPDGKGGWTEVKDGEWRASNDFQWLQVYPVAPVMEGKAGEGRPVLQVRVRGKGDGTRAPELDVAGFVPGMPWCTNQRNLHKRVCPAGDLPDVPVIRVGSRIGH